MVFGDSFGGWLFLDILFVFCFSDGWGGVVIVFLMILIVVFFGVVLVVLVLVVGVFLVIDCIDVILVFFRVCFCFFNCVVMWFCFWFVWCGGCVIRDRVLSEFFLLGVNILGWIFLKL